MRRRQNFLTLQAFWKERKRAAIGVVKDALAKVGALDKTLSNATVDQMAAQSSAEKIQGACGACHKMYREGDNQTGFRFRPGVF